MHLNKKPSMIRRFFFIVITGRSLRRIFVIENLLKEKTFIEIASMKNLAMTYEC